MYEVNPLIQARFKKQKVILDVITENRSYEVTDDRVLRSLVVLARISPFALETLKSEADLVEILKASAFNDLIEVLLENHLIIPATQAISQKAGIQYWVDHGWVDALILHLSTRNLTYSDDREKYSGLDDVVSAPHIEKTPKDFLKKNLKICQLPQASQNFSSASVLEGILQRRSFKPYRKTFISQDDLSDILWHANAYARSTAALIEGGTNDRDIVFDSAFSALDTYAVLYPSLTPTHKESALDCGLYAYDYADHELALLKEGNFSVNVTKLAIGQKKAGKGVISLIITGNWDAYRQRYQHSRSYRNLLVNVAELAQFYLTLLTMKGFNTFITPAIQDEEAIKFLDVKEKFPLYIVGAG